MGSDGDHMARAIRLGMRARGTTAENPPVGCVIARGAHVLGVGWTQAGGRPHAETAALAMAGAAARGAVAYVTLEPCAHHGRTGPCAEALIGAGIARVVCATIDPDARVAGRGIAMLRAAGIAVDIGLGAGGAREALAGFLIRTTMQRPQVILKLAVSADGMMASEVGVETRITGPETRARVHLMRASADAILVGRGTLAADDPELNVRLPGLEDRAPKRFIATSGAIAPDAKVQPASVFHSQLSLPGALAGLAAQGINTLFVEGGAKLARSFMAAGLVDKLYVFTAPITLGPSGLAAPLDAIAPGLRPVDEEQLGADRLTVYEPR